MTDTDQTADLKRQFRSLLDLDEKEDPNTLRVGDSVQDAYDDGHDSLYVTAAYDPSIETHPLDLEITP